MGGSKKCCGGPWTPGWLRVRSAARYADVSTRTIYTWFKMGLKHSKVRGIMLVKTEWLDKWLERFQVDQDKKAETNGLVNDVIKGLPIHDG